MMDSFLFYSARTKDRSVVTEIMCNNNIIENIIHSVGQHCGFFVNNSKLIKIICQHKSNNKTISLYFSRSLCLIKHM